MTDQQKGKTFVLLSKYHGSNQQLLSLAKHIKTQKVVPLRCELRSRSIAFYSVYRLIILMINRMGADSIFSRILIRLVLKNAPNALMEEDVILAKTPPFEFPLQLILAGSGGTSYFIGKPKRFKRDSYNYLISSPSTPVKDADICLDILPTSFTYSQVKLLRNKTINPKVECWCALLGGDAKGYSYTQEFWSSLVETLIEFAKSKNIRWLITTSPRTGKDVESYLKERLSQRDDVIAELSCWNDGENQRPSVGSYLARSKVVFVTEDSASMVSEALNSRLPTICLRPNDSKFNSLTVPLAEYHHKKNSLIRLEANSIDHRSLDIWIKERHTPLSLCWSEQVLKNTSI